MFHNLWAYRRCLLKYLLVTTNKQTSTGVNRFGGHVLRMNTSSQTYTQLWEWTFWRLSTACYQTLFQALRDVRYFLTPGLFNYCDHAWATGPRPFLSAAEYVRLAQLRILMPHISLCTSSLVSHTVTRAAGSFSLPLSGHLCFESNSGSALQTEDTWQCSVNRRRSAQQEPHTTWPSQPPKLQTASLLCLNEPSMCSQQEHT